VLVHPHHYFTATRAASLTGRGLHADCVIVDMSLEAVVMHLVQQLPGRAQVYLKEKVVLSLDLHQPDLGPGKGTHELRSAQSELCEVAQTKSSDTWTNLAPSPVEVSSTQHGEESSEEQDDTVLEPKPKQKVGPKIFTSELVEKASKLESTETRLTKRRELPIGEFVITITPKQLSQKKSGSAFKATKGISTIQLKNVAGAAAEVDLCVELGEAPFGQSVSVKHDFTVNPICIIPDLLDLKKAVVASNGTFCLKFTFSVNDVSV